MAVTLYVDRARWLVNVSSVLAGTPGIIPVVKGNGYGFGRAALARLAIDLGATELAVGTVHERAAVPPGPTVTVLTPALAHELGPRPDAVLTVAGRHHVETLVAAGTDAAVVVKLASPMRRYGVTPDELDEVLDSVARAGLRLHAFALHFPLASASAKHAHDVERWLALLPRGATVHVSHVDAVDLHRLGVDHPTVTIRARVGTGLWHGDKRPLALRADVVDRRPVAAGESAGYRLVEVPTDGHLVLASGGTAHGVQPLADGRSPFHFQRTRLALLEPPHMHTSMLFVPAGAPLPEVGDELELQRPLTQTWADRVVER